MAEFYHPAPFTAVNLKNKNFSCYIFMHLFKQLKLIRTFW
jgi:hypothetical protein